MIYINIFNFIIYVTYFFNEKAYFYSLPFEVKENKFHITDLTIFG